MKYKFSIFLLIVLLDVNIVFTKKLNYFELEQEKAISENCDEKTILFNSDDVKFIGRFYIKDDTTWLVLSGSAIEFYLTAKSAKLDLAGDNNAIYFPEDQRARFAIYLDDKQLLDTTMGELEKTIELFDNEEEKEIKVRIILLSEGSHGGIGVKSALINSCSDNPIKPTEYKKLRIEYI